MSDAIAGVDSGRRRPYSARGRHSRDQNDTGAAAARARPVSSLYKLSKYFALFSIIVYSLVLVMGSGHDPPPPLPQRTRASGGWHASSTPKGTPPPINLATKPPSSVSNLFSGDGLGSDDPRTYFGSRAHTVTPVNMDGHKGPIQTHTWYANLMLGNGSQQSWPMPYVVSWAGDGLWVHHPDEADLVFGPDAQTDPPKYFYAPVNIHSLKLGSASTVQSFNLQRIAKLSVEIHARTASGTIVYPLSVGAAFITAVYENEIPRVTSEVFFRAFEGPMQLGHNTSRWRATLENGTVWHIYWSGSSQLHLRKQDNATLTGSGRLSGVLQVAKVKTPEAQKVFDLNAGTYVTTITLGASVSGTSGTYTYTFHKQGLGKPLAFALPHHLASFDATTQSAVQHSIRLISQTKGNMTLVACGQWTMVEGSLPDEDAIALVPKMDDRTKGAVKRSLDADLAGNQTQAGADSMYYAGKALARTAQLVLLARAVGHAQAAQALKDFESKLMVFVNNKQQWPLVYDTTWGGIVSTAGFANGDGADFGGTWYNDHHFHYGYHIYAAAAYLTLAPSTAANRDKVRKWASFLVRDAASPFTDTAFPFSRAFDWFVGHSWSTGLYERADGKDEESSSEDVMFSYGAYVFGVATGDAALAARGRLMLAIQRRSLNTYMLMSPTAHVMPGKFADNYVSGITFMNKVDCTTWFGNNPEYIHGIHMLPHVPTTYYIRDKQQAKGEWDNRLAQVIETVQDGWRGVLMANTAIWDKSKAWTFFSDMNFNRNFLDDGASQSWYLAMVGLSQAG
ncbi:endo-1,3-beta glucanase [Savitreella phatthalungensis]